MKYVLLGLLALLAGCSDPAASRQSTLSPVHVIGSHGRLPGHFSSPRGIDIHPDGCIAVADRTGRIQILSAEGAPLREWILPAFENGTPTGIIFDTTRPGTSTLLVADTHYSRILRYSLDGKLVQQFGEYGGEPGKMIYPTDIALDPRGNLYITEYGIRDRVMKFAPDGHFIQEWGDSGTEPGQFQRALGIVWIPPGRLIVADTCNHRLQVFTDEGDLVAVWGKVGKGLGEFKYPYGLCVLGDGRILVCEYGNNRIQCLSAEGKPLGSYGRAGRAPGEFATPWDIAAGPDGKTVVVADTGNHRLQILDLARISWTGGGN
jgi:sugar lactone lactonase YvrE